MLEAVSWFARFKTGFFREFFLKGKEATGLCELLGIFEHIFEV